MAAPEVGQARVRKEMQNVTVPKEWASDLSPTALGPNAPFATPDSPQPIQHDGTVGLDELPDEDLIRLAESQGVVLSNSRSRDVTIAELQSFGIFRVLLPPS